jgi:hypothetical protein
MAEDDDAVETVVYQRQQGAKELGELFHGNRTVAEVEKNGEAQNHQARGGERLG